MNDREPKGPTDDQTSFLDNCCDAGDGHADIPPAIAQTSGAETMTRSDTETEARNRALAEAGFGTWSAGTGSPYDLLADDVSWTIVGHSDASKTYDSRAAFIDEVIRPFNARMSQGLKPTIRNLYPRVTTSSSSSTPAASRATESPTAILTHGSGRCATGRSRGRTPSSTASPSTTCGVASSRRSEVSSKPQARRT